MNKYLAAFWICIMVLVASMLFCVAYPAHAQVEPYASASIADFSKAGYSTPYVDLGAGVEANSARSLFRLDGYYSPTRKAGVPGSATTFGGSADGFWKVAMATLDSQSADGKRVSGTVRATLLLGAGLVGGETRTSEFVSHGFRYEGEAGLEFGATDQPGGRIRIIGRYVGPISDPHSLWELGLTPCLRYKKVEGCATAARFHTDVTGYQLSYQLGVKLFPF